MLEDIHAGRVVLPEFQRDFDWDDERVMQLLATVTRRWPAGSLLLQDFPGETFYKLRPFEGGPAVDLEKVKFVVLDGQQRLTALYHAVYNTGPYVYAVAAHTLAPDATIDVIEEGIRSFSREEWEAAEPASGWEGRIPFFSLRSAADFFGWRDHLVDTAERDMQIDLRRDLSDAYRHGLEAFHTYQLPAVIVEQDLEPAAIARIFERVNRAGLTLSAFDLMVAKTFETGWNLREKWDTACNDHEIIEEFFGDDGMPIIRVISLKATESVREGDVLRLSGLAVRKDWDLAVEACAEALTFLRASCGVRNPEWLPYGGMVITLAAVAFEYDLVEHVDVLVPWFLSRAFGLRYESGSNTVTVEEYKHLVRVLNGDAGLEQTPVVDVILREATRKRRSAIWRAFMCSLELNAARDIVTSEIPVEPRDTYVLAKEADPGPDVESPHLLVLNLLIAENASVRAVRGQGLGTLEELLSALSPKSRQRETSASQFLPESFTGIDDFLDGRLSLLMQFLESRMGFEVTKTERG
ncbi:MAG TPA: DUF262 domain-containing protein [Solirubrobacteraceae bacterium]|nr:DUF262 domain-containing protein [Solirubrobacteraceae bacterium]